MSDDPEVKTVALAMREFEMMSRAENLNLGLTMEALAEVAVKTIKRKELKNISDRVRVRLTPYAIECMEKNHKKLYADLSAEPYAFKPPEIDTNGWSEFGLWELMKEFGPYIYMGMRQILFVGNAIEVIIK